MATTGESQERVVLDAERSVLGAMLLHPDAVHDAGDMTRADWLLPRHTEIHRSVLSALTTTGKTDAITVADQLRQRGRLDECGGPDYLLDLLDSVVTAASVKRHAAIVRDAAERRRLAKVADQVARAARDGAPMPELLSMLDEARPAPSPAETRPGRSWRLVADDPPVEWIADGLVPIGGLVVLAAEPNAGKTLLVLDLALRAAHGHDWLGRSVRPCSTVYVAAEGGRGLGVRMRAWEAANPAALPAAGCYVHVDEGPLVDLGRADAVAQLEQVLTSAAAANGGNRPHVVVIDTLALALPGTDENDSGAMGAALAALAELRRRHGVSVLVLHHVRKPSKAGGKDTGMHALRGSSALAGAADVVLLAEDGREGVRTLRTVKVRDGELLPLLNYAIRSQDTGRTRADGRVETGPVVLVAQPVTEAETVSDKVADTAQLEAEVEAVVAVVRRERVGNKDTLWRLAGLNRGRGRMAVEVAEGRNWIKSIGKTKDRRYVIPGDGVNGQASGPTNGSRDTEDSRRPPHTPHAGGGANGARLPDATPAEWRESARIGAIGANGPDDGMPEQPGGRGRRARRGGAA